MYSHPTLVSPSLLVLSLCLCAVCCVLCAVCSPLCAQSCLCSLHRGQQLPHTCQCMGHHVSDKTRTSHHSPAPEDMHVCTCACVMMYRAWCRCATTARGYSQARGDGHTLVGIRALVADGHTMQTDKIYMFHKHAYLFPCVIITLA